MLKPEKLRGQLKWHTGGIKGKSLFLQHGSALVAQWDPYVGAPGSRGAVSIYGEPRGKTVFYKTWLGWKNAVWRFYRVRPPKGYHV